MIYPITKTLNGDPVIGIGGGSFSKTFLYRIVLRKTGDRYILKPAVFIRKTGDLSCSTSQGYVIAKPGDIIVDGSGYLPITNMNPDISLKAFRVDRIESDHVVGERIPLSDEIDIFDLPNQIITGAGLYHNRDGTFFSGVMIS